MCIIALHPKKQADDKDSLDRLPRDLLWRCRETYTDGMGIMYPAEDDYRIVTYRTMNDFDQIWNRYTTARDKNLPVAVHFRRTTAGNNSVDNCHPMRIADREVAFMHNGTLDGYTDLIDEDDDISDTRFFKKNVLDQMPLGFLQNDGLWHTIDQVTGRNRLLFMDGKGRWDVFNSSVGFWWKGVWFSHSRDRSYITTGRETTSSHVSGFAAGQNRYRCYICDCWTDHRPMDCPNKYDIDRMDASDCQFCGYDHHARRCPETVYRENQTRRCRLCDEMGGHVYMGNCKELNAECPTCGEIIEEDELVEIYDQDCYHLLCAETEILGESEDSGLTCSVCKHNIGMEDRRVMLGDRFVHAQCVDFAVDNDMDEDDSWLPDRADLSDAEAETSWTVYALDNGEDYKVQSYDEGIDVTNRGIYYGGIPLCWSCVNDLEFYNPQKAWEVIIPHRENLSCQGCGIVIFDRTEWIREESEA